jgi:hypothetical protein
MNQNVMQLAQGTIRPITTLEGDEPDVDMPWFQAVQWDNPPPNPISTDSATLSQSDTVAYAKEMLEQIFASATTRRAYYNTSRSWHKNFAQLGNGGGEYFSHWQTVLVDGLGAKAQGLNVNDFANIHRWMFLVLRRALLAITGHDPHPNPDEPRPTAAPAAPVNGAAAAAVMPAARRQTPRYRSFHWVPNDTSSPLGTYSNPELGAPTDQP